MHSIVKSSVVVSHRFPKQTIQETCEWPGVPKCESRKGVNLSLMLLFFLLHTTSQITSCVYN